MMWDIFQLHDGGESWTESNDTNEDRKIAGKIGEEAVEAVRKRKERLIRRESKIQALRTMNSVRRSLLEKSPRKSSIAEPKAKAEEPIEAQSTETQSTTINSAETAEKPSSSDQSIYQMAETAEKPYPSDLDSSPGRTFSNTDTFPGSE